TKGALNETAVVAERLGKACVKGGAVIMISNHPHLPRPKSLGDPGERLVCCRLAPVDKISGDHTKVGVGMARVDVIEGRGKPGAGVESVQGITRDDDVGIGQMNELHGGSVETALPISEARPGPSQPPTPGLSAFISSAATP